MFNNPAQVLAGTLIWPTGDDHQAFIENFLTNLQQLYTEGLPPALNPLFSVWNHPRLSRCVVMMVTWASEDHDAGRRWLARLEALATPTPSFSSSSSHSPSPPGFNTVRAGTLLEGIRVNDASVSPLVYGRCHTATVRGAGIGCADFVCAIAAHTAAPGAEGVGVALHRLVGPGTAGDKGAVWGLRQEHTVMEILSTTTDEAAVEVAFDWACGLRRAVVDAVPEEVVEGGWLAMMPDEEVDLEKVFGAENYRFLLELKRKWDPNNVFSNTVPKLPA